MTFCIGILVDDALVALADTRIVRGDQISSKSKLAVITHGGGTVFVMTSGLRSVRDKVMTQLGERLAARAAPLARLHEYATAFGEELVRVQAADGPALERAGLAFNLHAIIGGRLAGDPQPALFQVFPEGNWVDATPDAPYFIIGRNAYGKPILDRLLRADTPARKALALAYLAFDATRASVVDVDFPIDVAMIPRADGIARVGRFGAAELAGPHGWWHAQLGRALDGFPMDWAAPLRVDAI